MHHELKKTGLFTGVAAALLATAVLASRPTGGTSPGFDDQGQTFFPEFQTPEQAQALEVVGYDPNSTEVTTFKIAFKEGRWVIPSHSDYPADARDNLATTAAGVLGLVKDTIRSDRPEDHAALGVLDPLDPKVVAVEGLGTRITLRDGSDKVLADLIVGKPVPGAPNQRFVREPGRNRVYGVALDRLDLSTRFSKWIDTNLLGLATNQIREVVVSNQKFDPRRRALIPGEVVNLSKIPPAPTWTLAGEPIPEGQQLNASAVNDLTAALGNLEIAGVRPKPPALAAILQGKADQAQLSAGEGRQAVASLASSGFFQDRGRLLPEGGEVFVTLNDGVTYVLQFGAVTFARGEALTAGTGTPAPTEPEAPPAEGSPEPERPAGAIESRYLFVDAQFRPDVIPKPAASKPWFPDELPADPFAASPLARSTRQAAETQQREQAQKAYDARLEAGRKRAQELNQRFAGWYYVVPGDAYRRLMVSRSALIQEQSAAPPAGGVPGNPFGAPGAGNPFGGPGVPAGFPGGPGR